MTQSHIGQTLATKGQSMPINKSTILHASYDNKVYGLNQGSKVSPYGEMGSLKFDGTGTHIEIKDFGISTNMTVELWVKWTITTASVLMITNPQGFAIGFFGGNSLIMSPVANRTANLTGFINSEWNHIAVSYDNTGIPSCFINGVETTYTTVNSWSNPGAWIGKRDTGQFFNGQLSDIRIWNMPRTASQIALLMNTELTGREPGLIAHWKLNEGGGPVVCDHSSFGNDGIIIGSGTWTHGRSVATLRTDGKFTGAIAIEEATTNLMTNPVFLDSNLDGAAEGYSVGISGDGIDAGRVFTRMTKSGVNTPGNIQRIDITAVGNSATLYFIQAVTGIIAGATYTVSAYVKSSHAGKGLIQVRWMDTSGASIGGDVAGNPVSQSNSFERLVFTTAAPAGATRANIYVRGFGDTAGSWIEIEGLQLEQKAFATSFVDGSRPGGTLVYNSSPLIGQQEGTIALWFKPNNIFAGFSVILRAGRWANGFNGWSITKMNGTNQLYFEYGMPGVAGSVFSSGYTSNILEVEKWVFIVARWKATQVSIDVFKEDGIRNTMKVEGAIPVLDYGGYPISIGKDYMSSTSIPTNGLFSEVRIDTTWASDDEVLAWYQSNAPFYNYLDYSGEA